MDLSQDRPILDTVHIQRHTWFPNIQNAQWFWSPLTEIRIVLCLWLFKAVVMCVTIPPSLSMQLQPLPPYFSSYISRAVEKPGVEALPCSGINLITATISRWNFNGSYASVKSRHCLNSWKPIPSYEMAKSRRLIPGLNWNRTPYKFDMLHRYVYPHGGWEAAWKQKLEVVRDTIWREESRDVEYASLLQSRIQSSWKPHTSHILPDIKLEA
jgi:hypothetical protein